MFTLFHMDFMCLVFFFFVYTLLYAILTLLYYLHEYSSIHQALHFQYSSTTNGIVCLGYMHTFIPFDSAFSVKAADYRQAEGHCILLNYI